MKHDFQRRIQRYGWDKASAYYDDCWQKQLWPAQKNLIEKSDLQPGQMVLDVSCGSGLVTFPAADKVQQGGTVVGTDISDNMLKKAEEEARKRDIHNVSFQQMDAENLEFEPDSFNKVLCSLGLMYFPDPDKALEEIYRTLKPEGKAALLIWGERKNCGWADIFPIVDNRVKSEVCPLFFQLGTKDALSMTMESAGFLNVSVDRLNLSLFFENEEMACNAAFLGGPVALAYHKFDTETRTEVRKEFIDSISQFKNKNGYHLPGEFVIATGEKHVTNK
jgi:ubiquinone/menaquinone biosynthesis C-methylase UbiE